MQAEALERTRWGTGAMPSVDSGPAPEVSVVMPCLNEETTVGRCVRKAREWFASEGVVGEVIVVDNGSTDQSRALAAAAGARVIVEDRRGYGAALIRGIEEARAEHIVMGDCDDTYDFSDISHLVEPLRDGADMVVGNRYAGIQPGAMTWSHRYIGTPAISFLLRAFTGARLHDSQSGLRAFTRDAYLRMRAATDGMEFASEMILKASRQRMDVREVPIRYYPRDDESEAKLRTFRDGWRHLRFLLLATPSHLFTTPGLLLTAGGIGLLLASLFGPIHLLGGSWEPVYAAPLLTVLGVNALIFGAVARIATTHRGLTREDRTWRAARRLFTFEYSLVGGLALAGLGVLVDAAIAFTSGGDHIALAAISETCILVGGNLAFSGSLAAIMNGSN